MSGVRILGMVELPNKVKKQNLIFTNKKGEEKNPRLFFGSNK